MITEITITKIDIIDLSFLNDFMPINKLNRPMIKQIIAPNTLFIFGKIALKNKIKNNTCRPIPTFNKLLVIKSPF